MLCYTLDKQIGRVYSSRRLERAGSGVLEGAFFPAARGTFSPPGQTNREVPEHKRDGAQFAPQFFRP